MTPARPRTILAATAAVLTLSMLGSGAAPAAPAAPPAAAQQVGLRVGSYNIIANTSPGTFRAAVDALRTRVDVAGLQEVNSHEKEAVLASMGGWKHYRSPRFFGEQNPVIWNSDRFGFLSARAEKLSPRRFIGNEVAGRGPYLKSSFATVVHLDDRATGQKVSIVNVHLVPGAIKAGKRVPGRPLHFALYKEQVANLAAVTRTERAWGKVFVMGDFNIGFVADEKNRGRRLPFATFKRQSMPSMWATNRPANRGTHNDALIDQVYSTTAAARSTVAFDIKQSDHHPAIASYNLTVVQ